MTLTEMWGFLSIKNPGTLHKMGSQKHRAIVLQAGRNRDTSDEMFAHQQVPTRWNTQPTEFGEHDEKRDLTFMRSR